ncbi:hypothetical protein ACH5RR_002721 [Cinchona calisaya]|uniref:CCHC-type domain-containing protein n=1 Tax=Cinchona calisaya TaxID=153742 RepID=A0ABD3ASV6_9GENT
MDPAELRYLEDEDTPIMKTIKGATTGLVAATWHDVPRVERRVALPGLIRTLKMMGNYGITFAAVGGVYIGVEQLLQNYRMKRDFINGVVGGFAAGATVLGYKGKSIATAMSAGAALAATSTFIDVGGQTTRIDNGKEYYPYTTNACRGKYARVCVEIDLNKPLVPFIWVGDVLQSMEYEGLHQICFECGEYGHRQDVCRRTKETISPKQRS